MIRLAELATITGRTRESIRNITKARHTPWDESVFGDAGQRRYDGGHALALVVMEMLTEQGFRLREAAEAVATHKKVLAAFLDEVEASDNPAGCAERFVAGMRVCEEDDQTGRLWYPFFSFAGGDAEGILHAVSQQIARTGETSLSHGGKRLNRRIGGPHLAIAPVKECYLILRDRASRAGYEIVGRNIQKEAPEAGQ